MGNLSQWILRCFNLIPSNSKGEIGKTFFLTFMSCFFYSILQVRNNILFRGNVTFSKKKLIISTVKWMNSSSLPILPLLEPLPAFQTLQTAGSPLPPPPNDYLKINVDDLGKILFLSFSTVSCDFPLEVETFAVD